MNNQIFKASLGLVGLSYAEAASYFSAQLGRHISQNTIQDIVRGKSRVADDMWPVLRALYAQQVHSSEAALDLIDQQNPDELQLHTDSARGLEWPSDDVHHRALAMVALAVDLPVAD